MIMCSYALVVQRIGLRIADPVIEVRFLAGAPDQKLPASAGGFCVVGGPRGIEKSEYISRQPKGG